MKSLFAEDVDRLKRQASVIPLPTGGVMDATPRAPLLELPDYLVDDLRHASDLRFGQHSVGYGECCDPETGRWFGALTVFVSTGLTEALIDAYQQMLADHNISPDDCLIDHRRNLMAVWHS